MTVRMAQQFFVAILIVLLVVQNLYVNACSNIIVSPGASKDHSSYIAYNADSATLFGSLYHYPASDHPEKTMREIYDWDSGRYLGNIPEAAHTYNVVGNMNEFGVSIGETTFGGITSLQSQSAAKIDYGSLIWITLQRSKTAREAISTISDLMSTYGYASEGESFSIIDPKEAWVMEIIGKGNYELGAVWVAVKLPEGAVCAHANQARITTFPLHSPEHALYSPDVISFAQKVGLYPMDGTASGFSFSDVYDPLTFEGARLCEARVWSVYSSLMGQAWSAQYQDYALGVNLTNRMPLFVLPSNDHQLSIDSIASLMRSHYENTALDMSGVTFNDVGAVTNSIYRAHPLTWSSSLQSDGSIDTTGKTHSYTHERPIATPQTGWNFIAQSRSYIPSELSGLLWFGVDDAGTTVRTPVYSSATTVPQEFAGVGPQDGQIPPMMTFSWDSAFYVFNVVANFAYSRWDLIYPTLLSHITATEQTLIAQVQAIDIQALALYEEKGVDAAVQHVTQAGLVMGSQLLHDWQALFGKLFVQYRDGYIITEDKANTACGCYGASQSYPQSWLDRIVKENGPHFAIPDDKAASVSSSTGVKVKEEGLQPVKKTSLKSLR